ncbi:MAG: structural protein P5 [Bacteroidaceae bacterium]|nr:structural protein P5 [Bacteroidaceae bacterium]
MPRGLRNHNPLNIRKSATKWQGMAERQDDVAFVSFVSNAWGYRAAFRVLRTYMVNYGLRSIEDIVSRWAPPKENHTRAYIDTVSRLSGIGSLVNLYITNKEDMVKVVMTMAQVENGVEANKWEVEEGYRLAFGF